MSEAPKSKGGTYGLQEEREERGRAIKADEKFRQLLARAHPFDRTDATPPGTDSPRPLRAATGSMGGSSAGWMG